ncbi:MAG TPA: arginine deiminase-related protein [Steroidobacteraceae bacterium]|nr:arginine deiminase-related protein [Steroidobacteraceae bacterium]
MSLLPGLLLVEPAAFGFNAETAATNRFQSATELAPEVAAARARAEFAALAAALRGAGVPLAIATDSATPVKPDAVFPNNWVSFHEDGTLVLYPLRDPSRRAERREAVIEAARQQLGFRETRRIDLSAEEGHGRFLEGTGSLVLDRRARVAYACRSARTDESLVREWARLMDYEPYLFDAATADGTPVYHTNVLLWLGERIAGVGLEWVTPAQRAPLQRRLMDSGRDVLALDAAQLRHFAGNMLEVPVAGGLRLVASAAAAESLRPEQLQRLVAAGSQPLIAAVPTIERLGGGSVRCMLAEVPAQRSSQ